MTPEQRKLAADISWGQGLPAAKRRIVDDDDYFRKWLEACEYMLAIDAMLDAGMVPCREDDKPLHLKERVALLLTKATDRSRLAYELFKLFDEEYGHGIRNGYWPELKPLWEKARKEFEIP